MGDDGVPEGVPDGEERVGDEDEEGVIGES
jgi:hypothetical protein